MTAISHWLVPSYRDCGWGDLRLRGRRRNVRERPVAGLNSRDRKPVLWRTKVLGSFGEIHPWDSVDLRRFCPTASRVAFDLLKERIKSVHGRVAADAMCAVCAPRGWMIEVDLLLLFLAL